MGTSQEPTPAPTDRRGSQGSSHTGREKTHFPPLSERISFKRILKLQHILPRRHLPPFGHRDLLLRQHLRKVQKDQQQSEAEVQGGAHPFMVRSLLSLMRRSRKIGHCIPRSPSGGGSGEGNLDEATPPKLHLCASAASTGRGAARSSVRLNRQSNYGNFLRPDVAIRIQKSSSSNVNLSGGSGNNDDGSSTALAPAASSPGGGGDRRKSMGAELLRVALMRRGGTRNFAILLL